MLQTIKRIIWWDFARASWQWDIMCILIMCFIFFTPKSWYENKNPSVPNRMVKISPDKYSADAEALKAQVRALSGDPNAEVVASQRVTDDQGQTFYEVDISN
jgi:hypothetical protein